MTAESASGFGKNFMIVERWFFDTNVLVYLFDAKAPEKQRIARELLERAAAEAQPVISTQVLQEFFVTVTREQERGLPVPVARQFMQDLKKTIEVRQITTGHIFAATERVEQSNISFWDGLIVETAREAGATILWTEDLHDGWNADGTQVRNPFV